MMDIATLSKQVNFIRLSRRLRRDAIKGPGDIYTCAVKTTMKDSAKETKKITSPRQKVSNGQSTRVRNYRDRGAKHKGNGSVSRETSISDASPNASDHSSTSVTRNSSQSSMTDILLSEIKMLVSTAGHQACTEDLKRPSTSQLYADCGIDRKTRANDSVSKDLRFISYCKYNKCENSRRSPTSDGTVLASTPKIPTANGKVLLTSTPKACPVLESQSYSRAKPTKRRKESMPTTAKRPRSDKSMQTTAKHPRSDKSMQTTAKHPRSDQHDTTAKRPRSDQHHTTAKRQRSDQHHTTAKRSRSDQHHTTTKRPRSDQHHTTTKRPRSDQHHTTTKRPRSDQHHTTAKRPRSDQHNESAEPNKTQTDKKDQEVSKNSLFFSATSLSTKCGDIRTLSPNAFDNILTSTPNTLLKKSYSRNKTAKRRNKSMIDTKTKHTQNDQSTTLKQTPELKRLQKMKVRNQKLVDFLLCDTCKEYLKNIFCGKLKSELHTTFTQGSLKQKRAIKHQGFGQIEDEDQIDAIVMTYVDWLTEVNTNPYLQVVGYVLDVWVPEAVVLGLKKVKRYSKSRAWEMFRKGVRCTKAELDSMFNRTHNMSPPCMNLLPPNKTVKRLVLR